CWGWGRRAAVPHGLVADVNPGHGHIPVVDIPVGAARSAVFDKVVEGKPACYRPDNGGRHDEMSPRLRVPPHCLGRIAVERLRRKVTYVCCQSPHVRAGAVGAHAHLLPVWECRTGYGPGPEA